MKTFGKIIALAFVLFHTACEPYDTIRPIPSPDNLKTVTISAYLSPEEKDYGDGTMLLSWNGKATSNLAGEVNLSLLTDMAYDVDNKEYFHIPNGSFNLWSDDHRHTLIGTYMGRGHQIDGEFIIEGEINIQSGTGRFAHESASLNFFIRRFVPFSNTSVESEILITGKL